MGIDHKIEIKLPKFPKLFGKKKIEVKEEEKTEVGTDVGSAAKIVGGALLVGLAIGYLVGHHRGVGKGGTNVIIVDRGQLN